MRYVIDSDWVIDGTAGVASALSVIGRFRSEGIAISTAAVAEVYEGAFVLDDPAAGLAQLRDFMAGFVTLDVTEPVAEIFARIRADLRRQGNLIPDMDLLIAATVIAFDLQLLTRNLRHFSRVPDLRLHQPAPEVGRTGDQ